MSEQTVSAGFVRALLEFAVSKGAPRDALLCAAEIDAEAIADQDGRIPFARYVTLMRAAQEMTNDAALALHFGEAVNIADISIVGLIGRAADTMREALEQLSRYVRLVVDVACEGEHRFAFQQRQDGLWFVDMRADPNAFPELTESAFTQIVCRPRNAGVPQWARELRVTHPAPAYAHEYQRLFQAPVTFGAGWNAMRVDEAVISHKVGILPRYAFGVLTDRADALMADLESAATARGQLEKLLLPILHTGEASADGVAATLGVSRQTLYRNLKAEGVTFEQILDELRCRMALHYLRGKKVSINDAAYLVGFSDPTSFSRAFKRWTGKSPSEMRDQ